MKGEATQASPSGTPAYYPALFLALWTTGFIGCKAGIAHSSATAFLGLRFALAAVVLTLVAMAMRAPWPRSAAEYARLAIAGVLIHAAYLGPNYYAASVGFPVGITALIGALQPLLTAVLANRFLGEQVSRKQWIGLLVGLAGIVMVLEDRIAFDSRLWFEALLVGAGLVSLTVGTLYQRSRCGFQDLRTGAAVQLASAALVMGAATAIVPYRVEWTPTFVGALGWLIVVSAVTYAIMHVLFLRGAAARVASLFYLVPPMTSLVLYIFFDERLGVLALAGMALTIAGVALAMRK
ncbi:MAG: DMT family transporter [Burkholderiales bacterium]